MKADRTLEETKVFRDPIHGYIHVKMPVIWEAINSPEFQRLRRIRQLGGVFQIYHTAEHSRFAHSLGVYEIARRMVEEIESIRTSMTPKEKRAVLCAALLHDLGHGPFSHCFEQIVRESHESLTSRILLDPGTKIHQVLVQEEETLPEQVVSILEHRHPNRLLNMLISSQLDADRMDYLLRDTYETGTSYGKFDMERILRTLRSHEGILCIKNSGVRSVEDYIMCRYQMYWQVYLHSDSLSYELLIQLFFQRYAQIRRDISARLEPLEPMYETPLSVQAFLKLDDYRLFYGFQLAAEAEDPILSDLADRILNRRLFEWIEEPSLQQIQTLTSLLEEKGWPLAYSMVHQSSADQKYLPYREEGQMPIFVLNRSGQLEPLSQVSELAASLSLLKKDGINRLFFAKEVLEDCR